MNVLQVAKQYRSYSHEQKFKTTWNFWKLKKNGIALQLRFACCFISHLTNHKLVKHIMIHFKHSFTKKVFRFSMFSMISSVSDYSFHSFWHTFDQTWKSSLEIFFYLDFLYSVYQLCATRWLLFRHFIFHVGPQVLNEIKVQTVSRPFEKLDVVVIRKVFCNIGMVARGAILPKYLTLVKVLVKF